VLYYGVSGHFFSSFWSEMTLKFLICSPAVGCRHINSNCGGAVAGEENGWVPVQINTRLLHARLYSRHCEETRVSLPCVATHQKLEPASAYCCCSFLCVVRGINKLAFQLWSWSIQSETQAQPPHPTEKGSPNSIAKKSFVLRPKSCILNLKPIQSWLLPLAGTMGPLSPQPSRIPKVIQTGNLPQPTAKHISQYKSIHLLHCQVPNPNFLFSSISCHVRYVSIYLFGPKVLTTDLRKIVPAVCKSSHLPLMEHK